MQSLPAIMETLMVATDHDDTGTLVMASLQRCTLLLQSLHMHSTTTPGMNECAVSGRSPGLGGSTGAPENDETNPELPKWQSIARVEEGKKSRERTHGVGAEAPKARERSHGGGEDLPKARERTQHGPFGADIIPPKPTKTENSLCLVNPPKIPELSNLARTHCGQRTKHLGDGVRSARFDLCRLFEGQRILQFTARGTNHKGGELNRKGGLERLAGLHRVCRLWWVYVRRRPGKLRRIAGWVRLTDAGQHGNHQTQLRELTLRQGVGAGPSWRRRPSSVPGCRTRPPR